MLNIEYANVEACAKAVAENADLALGVKVRITDSVVGQNGLEPLRRAIRAAEMAGKQFRVMCHIGSAPGSLSDLLDLLRPGDILTHAYSGAGNNTVQNGRVLPAALAAKQRGVIIDVGHGGGSFDFTVCEPAMQQGFGPDTISSDIHAVSINTPGYPTMPWVMSKLLALGMPLEDVVARSTSEPGRIIGKVPGLGTLAVGAPADLAIFDLVDGPVEFVDTRNNKRAGTRKLVPVLTVKGGRPYGRPPLPIPFLY
jgi:dihydroorotase